MRILNKITELAMLMSIVVSAASCNKITLFDEAFVAFDTAKSSVVSINATGEFTGSYTLHYTGPKPSAPIVVNFVVTCGNGLAEGVDYKVVTAGGKITFMPGIYEQVIKTTLGKAVELYGDGNLKGEMVLILKGKEETSSDEEITIEYAIELAKKSVESGMSTSEAAKNAAKLTGFKKGEIYKALL